MLAVKAQSTPFSIHCDPQEPKPTASSKMMMSWLKSSTPTKRKEPETNEKNEESTKKLCKSPGTLKQWLQGENKAPKTTV